MMFLESPVPILVVGIVLEAVLAIALMRTGRGVLLWPIALVALLVSAGVAIERLVVTERERVAMTLDEAAAAITANDLDRLLACISADPKLPSALKTRADARREIQVYQVTQIRIRNLDPPEINSLTSPPTATAKFMAVVTGGDRAGNVRDLTQPIWLTVDLQKEGDRWRITDYKWRPTPGEPR